MAADKLIRGKLANGYKEMKPPPARGPASARGRSGTPGNSSPPSAWDELAAAMRAHTGRDLAVGKDQTRDRGWGLRR